MPKPIKSLLPHYLKLPNPLINQRLWSIITLGNLLHFRIEYLFSFMPEYIDNHFWGCRKNCPGINLQSQNKIPQLLLRLPGLFHLYLLYTLKHHIFLLLINIYFLNFSPPMCKSKVNHKTEPVFQFLFKLWLYLNLLFRLDMQHIVNSIDLLFLTNSIINNLVLILHYSLIKYFLKLL